MTLTKAELADLLFEKVGLNKREAKDMVEAFFEEIRGALERGESVKLSGFSLRARGDLRRQLAAQHHDRNVELIPARAPSRPVSPFR